MRERERETRTTKPMIMTDTTTDDIPVDVEAESIATKNGAEVAEKYGKAWTKAIVEGDMADFVGLFAAQEGPVIVVLQNAIGIPIEFTVGDQAGANMTWEELRNVTVQDLEAQDFLKVEAQCLGVLGDRMIMETGRFNKAGEVYMEAYGLLTLNKEGKILALEAFSDPQVAKLMAAAQEKLS